MKVLKGDKKPTNIKKLFDNIEFIGHFDYKEDFQMYRLIKPSVNNSTLGCYSVHIFHDEGQAKAVIHDRRWRDSQAHTVLKDAYAYIGWELTDYDSSKVLHHNAFRQTPAQVRSEVVDSYGVEVEPYLEFDGKRITRKCFRVKQRIGIETHDRFDYGSDLLDITREEDRGDIYTAVIPRGNGEEGIANSKIEIDTIAWSKANGDPVDKPLGQNWLEVPTATQQYGYVEDGAVSPRTIVMDFETDDVPELAQLAWEWINENCVPKSLMETVVHTVGRNYGLGDSIGIVYKEADIIKKARIQKAERNLKRPILTKFQIGDYDYFIKNTVTRQYRKKLNNIEQSTNKTVEVLNDRFNNKYDEAVRRIDNSANAVKDYADAQIIAKEQEYKENWDIRDKELNDSIEKLAGGSLDGIQTNVTELYTDMLKKLEQADLQPLESRLEASEKGIEGVFTNLGQLSGARNILSSENVSYIESAKVFMAGDYIASGDYVFSIHNPLYHNTKIDFTVYSMVEGKIIYLINTTLTDMSTPFRFSIEDSVKEPTFLFSISNFTMSDFEKAKIQLERGTEMTEWSPALADVGNVAELSSRITFNEERLHTAFTKIEGISIKENLATNTIGRHLYDRNYKTYNLQLKEMLNKPFMISFDLELESYVEGMTDFVPRFEFEDGSSKNEFIPIAQTSEKQKVVHVYSGAAIKNIKLGTYNANHHSSGYISNVMVEYLDDGQTEPSPYSVSPIEMPNSISQLRSEFDLTAEKLETTFVKVNENTGEISNVKQTASNISQSVNSMSNKVDSLEGWRADKGALFDMTADKVQQSVWLGDVGGRNLLPYSELPKYNDWWNDRGTDVRHYSTSTIGLTEYMWVNVMSGIGGRYMAVLSPLLTEPVSEGTTYKLQFKTTHRQNIREWMSYVYLMNEDGTANQGTRIEDQETIKVGENEFNGQDILLHVFTIKANFSGRARLLIGTHALNDGNARFYLRDVKIEKGELTAYTPSTADFLQQTDFILQAEGFFLGGKYVGGSHYSTAIVGDAGGLKLLGDNIDVHGNLNVKGDVDAWSVSAVTANLGRVFADTVQAGFIKGKHVEFDSAFIKDFVGKSAFIDYAQIKAANIRDLETISLTSEQVKVGFNKIGNNVQITNSGLDTLSNGRLTSRMNATGHHFYKDGIYGGFIGVIPRTTQPSKLGLSFNMTDKTDYMAWTHDDDGDGTYTTKMVWAKDNTIDFTAKGFNFTDPVRMTKKLSVESSIEATSTIQAGTRAKLQSSGNGARLYASDNVWLYVNEDGQVGISVNGTAHAIITV